jgi:hypothetical protein
MLAFVSLLFRSLAPSGGGPAARRRPSLGATGDDLVGLPRQSRRRGSAEPHAAGPRTTVAASSSTSELARLHRRHMVGETGGSHGAASRKPGPVAGYLARRLCRRQTARPPPTGLAGQRRLLRVEVADAETVPHLLALQVVEDNGREALDVAPDQTLADLGPARHRIPGVAEAVAQLPEVPGPA